VDGERQEQKEEENPHDEPRRNGTASEASLLHA
jgi:hypothetical protein